MPTRNAGPVQRRQGGRPRAGGSGSRSARAATAVPAKPATAVTSVPETEYAGLLGDRGLGPAVPVGGLGLDGQQVRLLQSLQRHYGNDHVARVVGLLRQAPPAKVGPPLSVQLQGATTCAPPEAPVSKPPQEDPKFKAVESKIQGAAADQKKHPSAKSKVAEAQGAAVPPANDTDSQAKAAQADKMGAAKPGVFDKAAFIAAVNKAIADASPKTLEEADEFSSSGKAGEVKNQVMDKVTKGKDDSAKDVKEKTGETPDPSAAKPKPVTPMAEEKPGPKAQDPGAASAMPAPAPPEQTNLGAGKCETDQKMADAEVTEEHLKKSNEPEMQQAVEAKKEGEEHSAKAPADVKAQEAQKLQTAKAGATSGTTTALDAMHQKKGAALGHVGGDKGAAKARDEAKRAEVSTHIEGIFTATKTEVDGILNGLDAKVSEKFTKGEAEARQAFEQNHKTEMERWKDERYSGITGAGQWLVDKIKGLPPEANDIYVRARNLYLSRMNQTIADVADVVGGELTRAKNRINQGREEIKKYVAGLDPQLKKFGAEAEKNVASKFDDLDKDVDAKKDAVVSDLAQKYVEARNSVDASIKQMQDENKGLWDKAKAMVGDAIEAILKLKDLFMGLLAKAASAFTKILSAPLEFISNFMGALKQGFMNFASNILEHLKKGLMGWLFGALAEAGIEIPETFDFKGILKLVLSILGLTWPAIKAFIAKAFPWAAKVIDFIESKVEIVGIIVKEGVGGLWKWIKDKIGDLKDMILTPIKDFIVEKVVKAGITWVLGMLNPAGALIKIVQALVSVVQWIMERGAALMEFVGTVVDAVSDIASGGLGGVPAKIEAALGKAVPLVISFLAGLLGLGGISDMIKSTFDKVRKPVMNVVHAVVGAAVKGAKNLIKGIKGMFGKKDKDKGAGVEIPETERQRHAAIATSVAHEMQQPDSAAADLSALRARKLEQARQLEETHQASLSPGIKIRIRETSPGGAELHFRVEIAPNATVITFPVGFSVSLRQFVSIDAEEMYSADSHIRLKHVHLQGEFATREELAQRVLRGWSDPMAGAGGAAPSGGFNQPSKAGYFLSVEEANTQLRQVINGELSARWTSQAQPALEGPNHYFSWTSTARFSRHAQAGLQRNSALGTKAQLAALLASNDISHPSGHGRYRVYPLYPGDPNYEYDPTSGQPNNSANPLTVPEFAGPDFPIYVGLKADPAKHVRGGWYVNSAYPSV